MIGKLTVCKKYPIPRVPAKGEKSELKSLSYLKLLSVGKVGITEPDTISKSVVANA